jgi:hypothetical protein
MQAAMMEMMKRRMAATPRIYDVTLAAMMAMMMMRMAATQTPMRIFIFMFSQ